MKKLLRFLLFILLLFLALTLPKSCGGSGETTTDALKLVEINKFGGTMAVFRDRDDDGVYFLDLTEAILTDENGDSISIQSLSPGMIVEITWDGQIQDASPASISADALQVVEQADDLVGLYLTALTGLWDGNSDLVKGAKRLQLDVSALTHLTGAEQAALAYLCSCKMSFLPYELTAWDGLAADGSVQFSVTPEGTPDSGAFSFTVQLCRGSQPPVCAVFTASRGESGQWSCTALS